MIAIVDSGGANLASITNLFDLIGVVYQVTRDPSTIQSAEKVILPGVGSARDSMARLYKYGLIETIRGLKQPVLGICLGMQLLFESSEEGDVACLGVIPGRVHALKKCKQLPVPHMGWNKLTKVHETPLLDGISADAGSDGPYVYFVHSYAAPSGEFVKAECLYGERIPAIVGKDNFFGCQFHPERSGPVGRIILENFIR